MPEVSEEELKCLDEYHEYIREESKEIGEFHGIKKCEPCPHHSHMTNVSFK